MKSVPEPTGSSPHFRKLPEIEMKLAMKRVINMLGCKQGDSKRNTMVLITILGWLFANGAVQADGGEKPNVGADAVNARVFNVHKPGPIRLSRSCVNSGKIP